MAISVIVLGVIIVGVILFVRKTKNLDDKESEKLVDQEYGKT